MLLLLCHCLDQQQIIPHFDTLRYFSVILLSYYPTNFTPSFYNQTFKLPHDILNGALLEHCFNWYAMLIG